MVKVALELRGDVLTQRERDILVLRFGLADEPPRTLQVIGDEYGLTRQRIKQIVDVALRKLGVNPW